MEDYIIDEIFKVVNGVPSLGGISIGQPDGECIDKLEILRDAKHHYDSSLEYVSDYQIVFDYGLLDDYAFNVSARLYVGKDELKVGKQIASVIRGRFYNTEVNENYKTTQFVEDNEFSVVISNDFYEITVSGSGEGYIDIDIEAKIDDWKIYKALYEISQDPDLYKFISTSALIDYPPLFDGYVRSYHGFFEFNSFFYLGGEIKSMEENYEYNYDLLSKREKRVKDKGIDIYYEVDEDSMKIVEKIRMWFPKKCEQLPDIVNFFRYAFLAENSSAVYEYDDFEGEVKNIDVQLSNKYFSLRIYINPNDKDNVRVEFTHRTNPETLMNLRTILKDPDLLGYIIHTHTR